MDKRKISEECEVNVIVTIHKKGDNRKEVTENKNYRSICFSSVILKLYTGVVENRLKNILERKLEQKEAVFSKGRGTIDTIFLIRNKRGKMEIEELYLTFVDLRESLESIQRGQYGGM